MSIALYLSEELLDVKTFQPQATHGYHQIVFFIEKRDWKVGFKFSNNIFANWGWILRVVPAN